MPSIAGMARATPEAMTWLALLVAAIAAGKYGKRVEPEVLVLKVRTDERVDLSAVADVEPCIHTTRRGAWISKRTDEQPTGGRRIRTARLHDHRTHVVCKQK